MKVLYIGYYREPTIWGQQCVDTVRALEDIPEFDVVCRCLDLRDGGVTPSVLAGLEHKSEQGSEVCYQQVLDDHYVSSEGIFKHTKHITDNWNVIHPDVLRQKYEPLNIEGATGYKFYSITDGSRKERRNLDGIYSRFIIDGLHPASNATYTIFTSNPEAIQKDLEEIEDVQNTIRTIIVPIESTQVPLPQIHNWGDHYKCLTPYKDTNVIFSQNFGYHNGMAQFFGTQPWCGSPAKNFEDWCENPVAFDLEWRKLGINRNAGRWERIKENLKEGVLDAQD